MLSRLSDANRRLGLLEEGIQQATEALEAYKMLGDTRGQAMCFVDLASLLRCDNQLLAAQEATSRAVEVLPEDGEEFLVCRCHRLFGDINHSKGEREKAIHHFEAALKIASSFDWNTQLSLVHDSLAMLFYNEGSLDDALVHGRPGQVTCSR